MGKVAQLTVNFRHLRFKRVFAQSRLLFELKSSNPNHKLKIRFILLPNSQLVVQFHNVTDVFTLLNLGKRFLLLNY